MTALPPEDELPDDKTIVPSAHTPEPEYEPGDLRPNSAPIPPRPEGSRVNPHGIKRSHTFSRQTGGVLGQRHRQPQRQAQSPWTGQQPIQQGQPAPQGQEAQRVQGGQQPQGQQWQGWQTPSAPSAPSVSQNGMPYASVGGYNQNHYSQQYAPSNIGLIGGLIAVVGAMMAIMSPFVTLIHVPTEDVRLWGAATGSQNAYVIFAAAVAGLVAAAFMMMSNRAPKNALVGGGLSVMAGIVAGGMATYLVTNSSHRAQIAQGSTFGLGVWLLIAATCALLVGGILGLVRGTTK